MDISLAQMNQECCGCGTCATVCPVGAISMVPRELGCLYPQIDSQKCIGCHACQKVCAYGKAEQIRNEPLCAYAAVAEEDALLQKSASGGVAAMLTRNVLDAGGIVYGCGLETEGGCLKPKHIGIQSREEAEKLQGSKYVQSDLGGIFPEIRQKLAQRKTVLFTGSPCQVDSLKRYLKDTDTARLYTVDLICHGVPSAALFQGYLQQLGERENGTVTHFSFRDKTDGWGLRARYRLLRRNGTDKTVILAPGLSSYYTFFLESEIYRESCYTCPYAGLARIGEITIGDFWGIAQEHPELLQENGGALKERNGVSAILVNSPKGKQLLEEFGAGLRLAESSPEKVTKWNSQLSKAAEHSALRNKLIGAWNQNGYKGIEKVFRKKLGIRYPVRLLKTRLHRR